MRFTCLQQIMSDCLGATGFILCGEVGRAASDALLTLEKVGG